MFLKRLELQGFKSFADKTVLDFGSGVTSVVGPNGSGKSNISDAIRWVMGEMSAKSLRGANMQDVIFAGTEKRKPLNYAEVSLVLDNSDRVFNLDFDEVIVTRRVFRSGETAYQINRSNCRLKDIHELFMDTGLGRDGYSIIGQGNVAQILSSKAEDRRNIFEEAAGISKYKYKKEEAERKLSQVDDNLVRIGDIAAELEGQIGPLKHQSEKARKYLAIYDEFKTLDINISMLSLKKNEVSTAEVNEKAELVNSEIEDIRSRESETEKKISAMYEESNALDEKQAEKNRQLVENKSRIMECKNEISLAENTAKNNSAMIERLENEARQLERRLEEKTSEADELFSVGEAKKGELSEAAQELSENQKRESEISEKISETEKKIAAHKASVTDILSKISSEKAKISGIEALRENYLSRRNALDEEIKSSRADLENRLSEQKELESKKAETEEKHRKLTDLIEKQNTSLREKNEQLMKMNDENNSDQIEYRSKSSKLHILEDMENDYDGYSKSVKVIMRSEETKKLSLYGTVAGLIDTDEKFAVAIETALGGASQNIVVETEEDAKAAIAFLRRTNSGRATFLPISSVKGRELDNIKEISAQNGFLGIASSLISYNKKYDGIMKSLLGRVVVVDNIDSGIAMSRRFSYRFRVVTLDGDVLNAGGSMSGGSSSRTGGFLSRAAEIKRLKSERGALEGKIRKSIEKINEIKAEINSVRTRLDSYIPMQREYENEILKCGEALKHISEFLSGGSSTQSGFEDELKQIEEKLGETGEKIAQSLSAVRRLEADERQENETIAELSQQLDEQIRQRDDGAEKNMQLTLKMTEIRHEIDSAENRRSQLLSEAEAARGEIQNKLSDAENIKNSKGALDYTRSEKQNQIDTLEKQEKALSEEIEALGERKSKITESLKSIQGSSKELTDRLILLQQELSRVAARQTKLAMEKDNIINRLWDDYELTYSDAEERFREPENEKEDTARLSELKGKLKALGNVNMDSIEEYKNVSERFEFLSKQKKDLEESKDNLGKIIVSMVELMEKHFTEQFSEITESFSFVFRELFGGGRGKLYLRDPENVLESGIEIDVQLPGKGLQNINLYSGGEKSFIAIALLFAILRVKPTPFCILDEIDAALDDVNVARFATYLKNYIEQSQFIVITHRRGTMEAANIMYGVTMQEKGVSKLLSLHIDDVDESMAN